MLRSILFLVLLLSRSALGMGRLRSIITPAIVSCLAASDYKPKRLLTDSKMDHEINKLIEEQELLSPPFRGGICDNTSLETPSDYIKIIPGKTPGFDHVKFARLKDKYLDAVNQEYLAVLEKEGVNKFELDQFIKQSLLTIGGVGSTEIEALQKTGTAIDPNLRRFIINKLKKHGLNLEHVVIAKQPAFNDWAASTEQGLRIMPYSILAVHSNDPYYVKKGNRIGVCDGGVLISELQLFDTIIEHECCHLLYNDFLPVNSVKNYSVKLYKIIEKRADIFGVFNCTNPISAVLCKTRSSIQNDNYDHRASTEWRVMTDEIISCYSDEIKAKWRPSLYMRTVGYVLGHSCLLFPKIEHVEE